MLKLTSVSQGKAPAYPDALVANYELTHSNPGRGNTLLTLNVRLHVMPLFGEIEATITDLTPKLKTDNPEEALDKLAEWMERGAKAIRARGKAKPLFNSYTPD